MRRTLPVSVLLLFAIPVSLSGEKDKHSGKFGDLHVTATQLESFESASHRGDHHHVAVFVRVENAGKGVICASFTATLRTSFDLEYHSDWVMPLPKWPKMDEMLPGESAEGSYDFNVKDGVKPLELVLKLFRGTIRCGAKGTEPLRDAFVPAEIRLDVHDLPEPKKPPTPPGQPPPPPSPFPPK